MNFSSFVYTCEELFAVALGAFDFHALQEAQPLLGPVFFFVYIWVVSIGLLGMFLTIIDNAFAEVSFKNYSLSSLHIRIPKLNIVKSPSLFLHQCTITTHRPRVYSIGQW